MVLPAIRSGGTSSGSRRLTARGTLAKGLPTPGWEAAPNRLLGPGRLSCPGISNSEGDDSRARDRTPLSAYRYLGSLAYVTVAAIAVPVSLRERHAVVFRISSTDLWNAPAQERKRFSAWAGNDKRE